MGTSNRNKKEFLEILKTYKISQIIDVRRWPTSKFPWFKKENFKKFLKKHKVEYFHLEQLGGYRGGYEKYVKTREFKQGLKNLIEIAKKKTSAIVCAEKFPWWCHRRFISKALQKKGFKILHILDKIKTWEK